MRANNIHHVLRKSSGMGGFHRGALLPERRWRIADIGLASALEHASIAETDQRRSLDAALTAGVISCWMRATIQSGEASRTVFALRVQRGFRTADRNSSGRSVVARPVLVDAMQFVNSTLAPFAGSRPPRLAAWRIVRAQGPVAVQAVSSLCAFRFVRHVDTQA